MDDEQVLGPAQDEPPQGRAARSAEGVERGVEDREPPVVRRAGHLPPHLFPGRLRRRGGGQRVDDVVTLHPGGRGSSARRGGQDVGRRVGPAQLRRVRRQLPEPLQQDGAATVPSGPVQGVGAQTEFGVPGEEIEVVGEGVEGPAEDPLGLVVVVVLVLGHVRAGEGEEERRLGPFRLQGRLRGLTRLRVPARGDQRGRANARRP
ncbi:hypothetical protein ACQ86F_02210 [Streptomyces venezuelae ATCC 10712]